MLPETMLPPVRTYGISGIAHLSVPVYCSELEIRPVIISRDFGQICRIQRIAHFSMQLQITDVQFAYYTRSNALIVYKYLMLSLSLPVTRLPYSRKFWRRIKFAGLVIANGTAKFNFRQLSARKNYVMKFCFAITNRQI